MARGKEIAYHTRLLIVTLYDSGESISSVAKTSKTRSAVRKIVKKWKETKSVGNKRKTGRPRKTTSREDRKLVGLN